MKTSYILKNITNKPFKVLAILLRFHKHLQYLKVVQKYLEELRIIKSEIDCV